MKPAWDKLMSEYKGDGLIADVDCTVHQSVCESAGVQGYPTIKYGATADLQDYNGGRDFDALLKHANENLGPQCGPGDNLHLCDPDAKAQIEAAMGKSMADLEADIKAGDDKIKNAEETFEAEVKKLQETYEGLQKSKDETIAEVKSSGLGMQKTVKAFRLKNEKKEL